MLTHPKRLNPPTVQQHLCACFAFLLLHIFLTHAAATEAPEASKASLLNVSSGPERVRLKEQALLRVLWQSSTIVRGRIRQARYTIQSAA